MGCLAILVGGTGFLLSVAPHHQAVSAAGRDIPPGLAGLVDEIESVTGGAAEVSFDAGTGKARFVRTALASPVPQPASLPATATPEQAARGFFSEYGSLFGVTNQAKQLSTSRTATVADGRSFVRFQQLHNGVPVMGGELIVQVAAQGNGILSATGETVTGAGLSTTPAVASGSARETALAMVAKYCATGISDLRCSRPSLWVYSPSVLGVDRDESSLVWRMEVESANGQPVRELVLVDAQRGFVALHFSQIDTAKSRQVYNASCGSTLPGTLARSEGQGATGNTQVDKAYTYSGYTYDFYYTQHGRDSIDGAGMTIISTVNYDEDGGCDYQNAFWDGSQLVLGTGFASACDVVAHEISHGVTQYESNLFYYMQSGAINESFSDIWGEFTELTYNPGSAGNRWLIGEDLSIGAGRDMEDPTAYGQPDRMTSSYYACGGYWDDGGGVHTNSGVANKAAFLMVDGGSFNGYTVTGMGISKTADLFYEVQTNLLTSGSDYADLYNALQQAAVDLGYSPADCQTVQNAIDAVEMDQQPTVCPTREAPLCVVGVPSVLFSDDMEDPDSGNWQSGYLQGVDAWGYASAYATSGQSSLWGYDYYDVADYYVAMTFDVALPAGSRPYLHFTHAFEFDSYSTYYYDGGVLEYSTDAGASWHDTYGLYTHHGYGGTVSVMYDNPLAGRSAFVGCSSGYGSTRLDLSSLAGQSIRFRFRIGTDSTTDHLGWFIDDFQIYTEIVALPPTVNTLPATDTSESGATLNGEIASLGKSDFAAVSAGSYHSLAVCSDHTLWAWGSNNCGELGQGDSGYFTERLSPVRVGSDSDWVAVSAGDYYSLGLRLDGTLWAWGGNGAGVLGLGDTTGRLVPEQVGSDSDWVAVSAGSSHCLGLRSDGTLWAWGSNYCGQLGLGDTADRLAPEQVGSDTDWEAVSAGFRHSLAVRSDGTLWSWGLNYRGQLGLGDTDTRTSPTQVGSDTSWDEVGAGYHYSLGLRSDGTVWAWGYNSEGELGVGDNSDRSTPTQVGVDNGWDSLTGSTYHTLGLRSDGTLWAWGANYYGELGLGDTADRWGPTQVGSASDWLVASAGRCHSLVVRSDGTLWTCGFGGQGMLGLGDSDNRQHLERVDSLPCEAWFEWGLTTSYGNSTPRQTVGELGQFNAYISGLQAGATYNFRACAAGASASCAGSLQFTAVSPDTTAPNVPTLLTPANGKATTDSTPWLDWSTVTDATAVHYQLQVDDSADCLSPVVSKTWLNGSSWSVDTVLPDGVYYWRVKAVDDAGNASAWTGAWTFRVDTTAPAVPTLVTLANGKVTMDSTPWLDWSTVTDATAVHYQLQVDESADCLSPVVSKTWLNGSSWSVDTVLPDGVYYWRVRAVDGAGNAGAWTGALTFRVDTTAPGVPALLTPANAKVTTDSTPWLDWSTVTDATAVHYQVQVDDSADCLSPVVNKTWLNGSSWSVDTVLPDRLYYWRVRAVDAAGNASAWASPWTFRVDTAAPAVPTLLTPIDGKVTSDSTPWLDWSTVTDATAVHYQLQVDDSADCLSPVVSKTWLNGSSWSVDPVLPDGVYYWRVRAVDAAGNASLWTGAWTFTVQ